jgi:hypothetical protein
MSTRVQCRVHVICMYMYEHNKGTVVVLIKYHDVNASVVMARSDLHGFGRLARHVEKNFHLSRFYSTVIRSICIPCSYWLASSTKLVARRTLGELGNKAPGCLRASSLEAVFHSDGHRRDYIADQRRKFLVVRR